MVDQQQDFEVESSATTTVEVDRATNTSLYSESDEFRNRICQFKISLNNSETQTIYGIPLGGARQHSSSGDDQLLGSVTLECDANITAPILHIQTARNILLADFHI